MIHDMPLKKLPIPLHPVAFIIFSASHFNTYFHIFSTLIYRPLEEN